MTTALLVGGGVAIVIVLIFLVARVSKAAGDAATRLEAIEHAQARRDAFDEETGRPLSSGQDLVNRLRRISKRMSGNSGR